MLGRATLILALAGWLLGGGQAKAWLPEQDQRFDAQFVTPFNLVRGVDIVALDLFETSTAQVADLRARGVRTICYINAGAWENWRPDAREYPPTAIGRAYAGWPGERWLDVRALKSLEKVLRNRIELCRDKGFDGVEFDNVDGYVNRTGFTLSAADQLAFNRWLAGEAHKAKLAVALKNTLELVPDLVTVFDFAISESCFSEGSCEALLPFRDAGKAVYVIEYTNQRRKMDRYCAEAVELELQLVFKTKSLNGKLHRRCP
jgi:endo-alpha-1,4-polygalactosaminidase (GH114 family)